MPAKQTTVEGLTDTTDTLDDINDKQERYFIIRTERGDVYIGIPVVELNQPTKYRLELKRKGLPQVELVSEPIPYIELVDTVQAWIRSRGAK